MATHTNDNGDTGPRRSPRLACLRRYCRPPAPPLRGGLTARQSGELERIANRYGTLRWRQRDDGTVAVAVLGNPPKPEHDDEVLLMLIRADGTLARLSHRAQPRYQPINAPR
jgi:hypothetical protein